MRNLIKFLAFSASIISSGPTWGAANNWKKTGPIILEKPGWIEVYTVERDATLIEATLLDSQDRALAFDSSNNRSFDIDSKIMFTNLQPGTYYVYVQTDGLDELNVYAMGRYTPDVLP